MFLPALGCRPVSRPVARAGTFQSHAIRPAGGRVVVGRPALGGVKTGEDWNEHRQVLRRRYLDLIRDEHKPPRPELDFRVHEDTEVAAVYRRFYISYQAEADELAHAYLGIPLGLTDAAPAIVALQHGTPGHEANGGPGRRPHQGVPRPPLPARLRGDCAGALRFGRAHCARVARTYLRLPRRPFEARRGHASQAVAVEAKVPYSNTECVHPAVCHS